MATKKTKKRAPKKKAPSARSKRVSAPTANTSNGAPADPEALVPAQPDPNSGPTRAEQRRAAREARQARRGAAAEPSGGTVTPIRPELKPTDRAPVEIELPEILRLKIEAATAKVQLARERLKKPIEQQIAKLFEQHMREACEKDPDYQAAYKNQEAALNEVIADATPKLPADYALARIDEQTGKATAIYNPDRAGKLLGKVKT